MARTLDDFIASLPFEEQHAIHQEAERLIAEEMTLRALRKARACSQEKVGHLLHIKQAAVSRLERRTDMYVSTLRSFIEAMGGELDIIARFPDHPSVRISQFEELGSVNVQKVNAYGEVVHPGFRADLDTNVILNGGCASPNDDYPPKILPTHKGP